MEKLREKQFAGRPVYGEIIAEAKNDCVEAKIIKVDNLTNLVTVEERNLYKVFIANDQEEFFDVLTTELPEDILDALVHQLRQKQEI